MSSLSCFFFHFFILSKVKFIKKIETLHQFPQLRGSAKCLHFIIIMLNSRIKPRRLNRRMMASATSLCRQSSQAHQQEHEEHP